MPALRHQLFMIAPFDDAAVLDHDDLDASAFADPLPRPLECPLGLARVDGWGNIT